MIYNKIPNKVNPIIPDLLSDSVGENAKKFPTVHFPPYKAVLGEILAREEKVGKRAM